MSEHITISKYPVSVTYLNKEGRFQQFIRFNFLTRTLVGIDIVSRSTGIQISFDKNLDIEAVLTNSTHSSVTDIHAFKEAAQWALNIYNSDIKEQQE